jgi:hypothetical protein
MLDRLREVNGGATQRTPAGTSSGRVYASRERIEALKRPTTWRHTGDGSLSSELAEDLFWGKRAVFHVLDWPAHEEADAKKGELT